VCHSILRPLFRLNALDERPQRICYVCSRTEETQEVEHYEKPIDDDGQKTD